MVVATWLCVLVLAPYGIAEGYPLWHVGAHVMSVVQSMMTTLLQSV